jgi:eukaryotic-like serine/threonine-protein kinase
MTESLPESMIGKILDGRFQITNYLTEGGMGRIYQATQLQLERTVALKLLKEPSEHVEEFKKRFYL